MLRLVVAGFLLTASCSGAMAAGWKYATMKMFDDNVSVVSSSAADGRQAFFICYPDQHLLVFSSEIEVLDRRPNHQGEQKIDYDTLKVSVKWTVDGVPGPTRKWEKKGLSVSADPATTRALVEALRTAKQGLVVTWGRQSVTFDAAGAFKALNSLSKACG
ncbi:MAG: hypothetical protein EON57_10175 [Alphaproteobacteria bacterium]|nr:MAG: hypothetical protein EON57_10175 [Alphaproteobacteria bacterium]